MLLVLNERFQFLTFTETFLLLLLMYCLLCLFLSSLMNYNLSFFDISIISSAMKPWFLTQKDTFLFVNIISSALMRVAIKAPRYEV